MKQALQFNLVFSLISAFVLILFSKYIDQLFQTTNPLVYQIIGGGLLYFSFSIFREMKRLRPIKIFAIIFQDMLWVIASIVLLIMDPFSISPVGNFIIIGIALIVLFMGLNQARELAKVDEVKNNNVKEFQFSTIVNASKERAWTIISDVENYHKIAPNIDQSKILSGSEKGLVRQCTHGKNQWTETCTLWNENNKYAFKVNTNAPDYPYPFQELQGIWEVISVDDSKTKINMSFEFSYTKGIYKVLLHPFLRKKFKAVSDELLQNWKKKIEQ